MRSACVLNTAAALGFMPRSASQRTRGRGDGVDHAAGEVRDTRLTTPMRVTRDVIMEATRICPRKWASA